MWKKLNSFRNKKKQKKALQTLHDLHEMVGILDEWARHGLIFWRRKDNILIIEEYVALLKLAEGRKGFLKFLNQIVVWQNSKLIDEAYESHRVHVETEAVQSAEQVCKSHQSRHYAHPTGGKRKYAYAAHRAA